MMAEPHTTAAAGVLGVKYAALVAGFAGGVVSLGFLRELDRRQMVLAVFTGAACGGYLTPLAMPVIARAMGIDVSVEMEGAAAFLVGVSAMNIIPAVIHLSEFLRRNPTQALRGKDEQK